MPHPQNFQGARPRPTPAPPKVTPPRPTPGKQAHLRRAQPQARQQPSHPVGAGPQLHSNIWVEPPVTSTEAWQPHHPSSAHLGPPENSGVNGRPSTFLHPRTDLFPINPTAACLTATPLPVWHATTPIGALPRSCRRRQPFISALHPIVSLTPRTSIPHPLHSGHTRPTLKKTYSIVFPGMR